MEKTLTEVLEILLKHCKKENGEKKVKRALNDAYCDGAKAEAVVLYSLHYLKD